MRNLPPGYSGDPFAADDDERHGPECTVMITRPCFASPCSCWCHRSYNLHIVLRDEEEVRAMFSKVEIFEIRHGTREWRAGDTS